MKPNLFRLIPIFLVCGFVWAEQPLLKNDPKRPTDKVARDLGITQEQFIACFNHVHPAPQGERPKSAQVFDNKSKLLSCIQRANPTVTNELLDTVMDRYRPGGREAQESESRSQ